MLCNITGNGWLVVVHVEEGELLRRGTVAVWELAQAAGTSPNIRHRGHAAQGSVERPSDARIRAKDLRLPRRPFGRISCGEVIGEADHSGVTTTTGVNPMLFKSIREHADIDRQSGGP